MPAEATPLLALLGAAAMSLMGAVATGIAAGFATDIYNYEMRKACDNFQGYEAFNEFCEMKESI